MASNLGYTCPKCSKHCRPDPKSPESFVCQCGLGFDDSAAELARLYKAVAYLLEKALQASTDGKEEEEAVLLSSVGEFVVKRLAVVAVGWAKQNKLDDAELHAEAAAVLEEGETT